MPLFAGKNKSRTGAAIAASRDFGRVGDGRLLYVVLTGI